MKFTTLFYAVKARLARPGSTCRGLSDNSPWHSVIAPSHRDDRLRQ